MPHMGNSEYLLCERAAKLLDHRIGEHVARNALYFALRLFTAQTAIESEFEIFSLADLFQTFIAHFLQRAVNGLALRIQDRFFERNVDVGFHVDLHYTSGQIRSAAGRCLREWFSRAAGWGFTWEENS